MPEIKFYTRSKVKNRIAPVYIRFTDRRDLRLSLKTPYRMIPEYWDYKRQTVTKNILGTAIFTRDQAKDIEDEFSKLRDVIFREYFKLPGLVTKEWLQATIDKFYYKGTPGKENLTQYIKRYVDEACRGKRLANAGNTKKRYSYGSLRVLRGFMLSFEKFCTGTGKQYNFSDISIDAYNDFVQFFYDRNCGANYIGKHIKSLKTIMRAARDEGLHNNMEIERKAFKTISEEVEHIYLTEAELKSIFELSLRKDKLLSEVRDVFLAGCYTAQRYSDYSRINKSNIKEIDGKKYIELIQKKTSEKCVIPIRPELETILQRYDYNLPKTFEQKVNLNIKKIGALAGITELVHVEKNRGGLKIKTDVKKCDLICTHTARRTGCSLMYLSGIPVIDIMKISGHRSPNEFLKYIRVGKEETAVSLAGHPYFRRNQLKIS